MNELLLDEVLESSSLVEGAKDIAWYIAKDLHSILSSEHSGFIDDAGIFQLVLEQRRPALLCRRGKELAQLLAVSRMNEERLR